MVASFTGYLLITSLLLTIAAKGYRAVDFDDSNLFGLLASATISDLFVFSVVIALCAGLEWVWRWNGVLTKIFVLVVTVISAMNAAFLVVAGEQASKQALKAMREQWEDLNLVLEEVITPGFTASVAGGFLAFGLLWYGLRRLARARYPKPGYAYCARDRFGVGLAASAVFGIVLALAPRQQTLREHALSQNWLYKVARTSLWRSNKGKFKAYEDNFMVTDAEVERFAALPDRPNVLLVVLESTRYDHTLLSGPDSPAQTPALKAIAEGGFVAHRTRTIVPHTSKALFTIMCSRYPLMQRGVLEVSTHVEIECLPEVLARAGYRTGFFQSAFGTFEHRPRMVDKFGFQEFQSWEDVGGPRLGYLASGDGSLVEPLRKWIKSVTEEGEGEDEEFEDRPQTPWMATVLTSATHHPYRLSGPLRRHIKKTYPDAPMKSRPDRYARLIEGEDLMLGRIVKMLERAGQLENTIIVVVGDHGEGFGDHGVSQHDNDFYEEGLRVPLVFAGPGVEARDYNENVSIIDIAPTLMGLLGLEIAEGSGVEGYDLMSPDHPGDSIPRYFACYSDWVCRGFVLGNQKLVFSPENAIPWAFDLEADPEEEHPALPDKTLEALLPAMHEIVDGHRTKTKKRIWPLLDRYPPWVCAAGAAICKHPKARKKRYRSYPLTIEHNLVRPLVDFIVPIPFEDFRDLVMPGRARKRRGKGGYRPKVRIEKPATSPEARVGTATTGAASKKKKKSIWARPSVQRGGKKKSAKKKTTTKKTKSAAKGTSSAGE